MVQYSAWGKGIVKTLLRVGHAAHTLHIREGEGCMDACRDGGMDGDDRPECCPSMHSYNNNNNRNNSNNNRVHCA